jgi:hypothetical protein
MDDGVGGVEQDPVAMGQAFDARRGQAARFEGLDETIGDRSDMDVGAPGCDHHEISEGGFAAQIDRDDVFRLGVFETGRDRLGEEAGVGFDGTGSRRQRLSGRFTGWRESQCLGPPSDRRMKGGLHET